ncbi:unnamed protein product, partial [Rotaria socialis]
RDISRGDDDAAVAIDCGALTLVILIRFEFLMVVGDGRSLFRMLFVDFSCGDNVCKVVCPESGEEFNGDVLL